eukprot:PITA_17655
MATRLTNRKDKDIKKLMMEGFKVKKVKDSNNKFYVEFKGPPDSLYQDGVWTVYVELSTDYPFKPPIIRFMDRIYHPNIAELYGNVCVDVLEREWSPINNLVNIFEMFLPQLLLEPNADEPINFGAGALMKSDKNAYEEKVKEYCLRYAQSGSFAWKQEEEGSTQEGESSEGTSENVSASGDEGTAGSADP